MKKRPIVLCIMDGYGISESINGNAVRLANTPNLDDLMAMYPNTTISASGMPVGLPDGQMGNSEVGHLNIGAGRTVYQSLTLINKALNEKTFFENEKFLKAIQHAKDNGSKLHIWGLLSNGGVHSSNEHIYGLLELAKQQGLDKVYVHAFLDVSYKQKTESYIKQTGISEKEAKQVFEDNLAYTMEKFPEHVMTDEMTEEYRELFADLAKKTSYTVGEATREENGTYQVVLTVKPITLLKDTYAEFQEKAQKYARKVSNDVMNGQAMPEETQMQTEIYQIYYEVLSQAAEKGLKYGKPNKIVLHVEKDKEGKYGIRKADLQNLDHLLIESVGEEQEEENS